MGSTPLPLAHEVTAAAAHAGRFRRAPALRSTAPSSPCSAPPSPPARFSSPGLYRPLATTPPWLGFRAVLRRCVSGGPRCRWSTPWEFPIHHGRCRQGLLQGDVKDAIDLQLLKVSSGDSTRQHEYRECFYWLRPKWRTKNNSLKETIRRELGGLVSSPGVSSCLLI
ncbi:hypothetical protein VPH35_001846 [Triticum aestivum]